VPLSAPQEERKKIKVNSEKRAIAKTTNEWRKAVKA
jgi:hypothetical protein